MPTRYRMIFAGPVGAGKTTAVRSLSDAPPVDTDVPMSATVPSDEDKTTTTVGLDFGTWRPTAEVSVALIGVPGQRRFAAARPNVSLPGTRILLWVRGDRDTMTTDAAEWLALFPAERHRLIVVVSHSHDRSIASIRRALADVLAQYGLPPSRVLAADARDRDAVMRVASAALDLPEENR
ncbi:hypothetical protein [Microbacterium paraoxydans]|uniref:Signal recognition particle receptor subunit beta, a GTPase n=1 Tax=Microbacterium paraoxydans TaxID=199592 RepID=A0ABS5IIM9_9MICO|nr:hypothetical protein [Microbacterium paraoxydans]MBS0022819.1 hypothetical protein [Microbacterium paraoxydans]